MSIVWPVLLPLSLPVSSANTIIQLKKKENLQNLFYMLGYSGLQWSTVVSIAVSDKFLRLIVLCKRIENEILAGLS